MAKWYDNFALIFAVSLSAPLLLPLFIVIRQRTLHGKYPSGFKDIDPLGMKIIKFAGIFFLFGVLNLGVYCILMFYF